VLLPFPHDNLAVSKHWSQPQSPAVSRSVVLLKRFSAGRDGSPLLGAQNWLRSRKTPVIRIRCI